MRPSHSGTWKIAIYISACRYIQYFGSCIDASQRTSTASRSSTFSLFANAMALPTCRAALGCAAVVRICSLLLLWLTIFGAQTATAQTQPVPSDVPPCGVCEPPSILVHDRCQARIDCHSLTRKPAAQLPPRSYPWIWLLLRRYALPMLQLGLAGQDQRLSSRQLHDAGSSWYVYLTEIQSKKTRCPHIGIAWILTELLQTWRGLLLQSAACQTNPNRRASSSRYHFSLSEQQYSLCFERFRKL